MKRYLFFIITLFLFLFWINGSYAFYALLYNTLPRFLTVILCLFVTPIISAFIIVTIVCWINKKLNLNYQEDKIKLTLLIPSLLLWLVLLIDLNTIDTKQYFHLSLHNDQPAFSTHDFNDIKNSSFVELKNVMIDHHLLIHTKSQHSSNSSGQVKVKSYRHLFALPLLPKTKSDNYQPKIWLVDRISTTSKDRTPSPFSSISFPIYGTINNDPYDRKTFTNLIPHQGDIILLNYSEQSYEKLSKKLHFKTMLFIGLLNIFFVFFPFWVSFKNR